MLSAAGFVGVSVRVNYRLGLCQLALTSTCVRYAPDSNRFALMGTRTNGGVRLQK